MDAQLPIYGLHVSVNRVPAQLQPYRNVFFRKTIGKKLANLPLRGRQDFRGGLQVASRLRRLTPM